MVKKFFIACCTILLFAGLIGFTSANNSFQLIPESNDETKADNASKELLELKPEGDFWGTYNKNAKTLEDDLGGQIRSGIFSRKSITQIIVYVLRFMMQIALVIGAGFVIWAGYQYAGFALGFGDPKKGPSYIINAAIGILIISLSYAIIKLLQMAFLS